MEGGGEGGGDGREGGGGGGGRDERSLHCFDIRTQRQQSSFPKDIELKSQKQEGALSLKNRFASIRPPQRMDASEKQPTSGASVGTVCLPGSATDFVQKFSRDFATQTFGQMSAAAPSESELSTEKKHETEVTKMLKRSLAEIKESIELHLGRIVRHSMSVDRQSPQNNADYLTTSETVKLSPGSFYSDNNGSSNYRATSSADRMTTENPRRHLASAAAAASESHNKTYLGSDFEEFPGKVLSHETGSVTSDEASDRSHKILTLMLEEIKDLKKFVCQQLDHRSSGNQGTVEELDPDSDSALGLEITGKSESKSDEGRRRRRRSDGASQSRPGHRRRRHDKEAEYDNYSKQSFQSKTLSAGSREDSPTDNYHARLALSKFQAARNRFLSLDASARRLWQEQQTDIGSNDKRHRPFVEGHYSDHHYSLCYQNQIPAQNATMGPSLGLAVPYMNSSDAYRRPVYQLPHTSSRSPVAPLGQNYQPSNPSLINPTHQLSQRLVTFVPLTWIPVGQTAAASHSGSLDAVQFKSDHTVHRQRSNSRVDQKNKGDELPNRKNVGDIFPQKETNESGVRRSTTKTKHTLNETFREVEKIRDIAERLGNGVINE